MPPAGRGARVNDSSAGWIWFVIVFMVIAFVISVLYQRHREKLARTWAASAGWTFVGVDRSLGSRWAGQPFGVGRARTAKEVLRGTFAERPATSFTYEYTTGAGKSQRTVAHHVVALALPAPLPAVELTHDGVGAGLAKAFGGQDIQFESAAFNERWRVEAADVKSAHDIVHPRLMERLLEPDALGMNLRIEGAHLLCWAGGAQDFDQIARYLTVMTAVVEHVPRFVWLDHGYDPART